MVRLATETDAEMLAQLNIAFNGPGDASLEHIRASLRENQQEVVIVDEANGILTGFLCLQIKRSFCYDTCAPEITELYVQPEYRRQGIASRMLLFAEEHCQKEYSCHGLELLTGDDNWIAQAVYRAAGYAPDGELHLSKPL